MEVATLGSFAGGEQPCAAAVGFFDGVHLGHRHLIGRVKAEAERLGILSAVVTFDVHPRQALQKEYRPQLLSTNEEKAGLLGGCGLDRCFVVGFGPDIAGMTARRFMEEILRDSFGVRCLVVGYDNRFGRNREDGFGQYEAYGRELGMEVVECGPLVAGGVNISSSHVRRLLSAGNVSAAAAALGRDYTLAGTVVEGRRVGRDIGFPTANLKPSCAMKTVPARGVYAAVAEVGGGKWPAMVNIGTKPTFGSFSTTVEAHLVGFSGDLYGRPMEIAFKERLRDEVEFRSPAELAARLEQDRRITKDILSKQGFQWTTD